MDKGFVLSVGISRVEERLADERMEKHHVLIRLRMKIQATLRVSLPPAQPGRCLRIFWNNMSRDPKIQLFEPVLRLTPNLRVLLHYRDPVDRYGKQEICMQMDDFGL